MVIRVARPSHFIRRVVEERRPVSFHGEHHTREAVLFIAAMVAILVVFGCSLTFGLVWFLSA